MEPVLDRHSAAVWLAIVFTFGWLLPAKDARADLFVFTLQSGGMIEGDWLNTHDRPLRFFHVRLGSGGVITLQRSQVSDFSRLPPALLTYRKIAPRYADNVEAQWQLAEWCREQGLDDQRQRHLQRIIQLDPDHVQARHGLGYTQVGSRWLTREQWLKEQGYVYYRGKWRLSQEVDLMEAASQRQRTQREWTTRLQRWRDAIVSDRSPETAEQFKQIRDHHAVPGLVQLATKEKLFPLKQLYIQALGNINHRSALMALINLSMNDDDLETFHACVDQIARLQSPLATAIYIDGLKSSNNMRVNRAAFVLGRLGDQSAIAPLIDALVTTHKVQPQQIPGQASGVNGLPISTTFVNTPPGQLGGRKNCNTSRLLPPVQGTVFSPTGQPQVVSVRVPNQEVLSALDRLTGGANFGFDQEAWRNWLRLERQQPANLASQTLR